MRTKKQLLAFGLCIALLLGMIPASAVSAAKKTALSTKKLTVRVGQSKKLKLKNNKKKVKWTVTSGKKNITLKSKKKKGVTVVGRKKGTAKVQAKVGKKKYTCKVTVKAKATPQPTPTPPKTSEQDKVLTLYYNGKNAGQVKEQISDSRKPVHLIVNDGVTSIENWAFGYCSNNLASITIPDSVVRIGASAFFDCDGLTSITIPDSVTSIGDNAFWDCGGLIRVTIGNGVTSIGKSAFAYCDGLTSITIPDSVIRIGDNAFSNCFALTSIVWNGKTYTDGDDFLIAFRNSKE